EVVVLHRHERAAVLDGFHQPVAVLAVHGVDALGRAVRGGQDADGGGVEHGDQGLHAVLVQRPLHLGVDPEVADLALDHLERRGLGVAHWLTSFICLIFCSRVRRTADNRAWTGPTCSQASSGFGGPSSTRPTISPSRMGRDFSHAASCLAASAGGVVSGFFFRSRTRGARPISFWWPDQMDSPVSTSAMICFAWARRCGSIWMWPLAVCQMISTRR